MTPVTTFAGKTVAVFGLGRSGLATCRALLAGGAAVVAADDTARSREAAAAAGFRVEDLKDADWSRFAALVLAPGVPLTHPEPHWTVAKARAAGVEIIGDIELFCRERAKSCPEAPFVAITGTNGKSTTTALIAHILRAAGRDAQMGGNIGTAILDLEPPAKDRIHVIEMSSFQIELTPSLIPSLGVLLNISPGRLGHTLFINDSKATNADSAATALAAFARDIYWILGGKPKEGGIASLERFFPRIAGAYLIGEASEEFAVTLDGKVGFARCGTLDAALAAATRDAAASDAAEPVVLLSPACASYDQFRNFEVRGDAFRALVAALPGIELRRG